MIKLKGVSELQYNQSLVVIGGIQLIVLVLFFRDIYLHTNIQYRHNNDVKFRQTIVIATKVYISCDVNLWVAAIEWTLK